jgi:hypothetical protein
MVAGRTGAVYLVFSFVCSRRAGHTFGANVDNATMGSILRHLTYRSAMRKKFLKVERLVVVRGIC